MKKEEAIKLLLLGLLTLLASGVFGRQDACAGQAGVIRERFALQLVSGPLFSPAIDPDAKDLDYVQTNLRFCWSLDPEKTAEKIKLGGYFDVIFEVTNSAIFKGPGSYLAGVTGLFRYNFIKQREFLAPYIQLGAGIVYNDVYKDDSQALIGQAVEFTPQAAVGLHYFLDKNWSLDAEVMFHHISNANMAKRNLGVNAMGGLIGVSLFF